MILRMLGTGPLAQLMSPPRWPDDSWLLQGPTDPLVVEPLAQDDEPEEPARWAAE